MHKRYWLAIQLVNCVAICIANYISQLYNYDKGYCLGQLCPSFSPAVNLKVQTWTLIIICFVSSSSSSSSSSSVIIIFADNQGGAPKVINCEHAGRVQRQPLLDSQRAELQLYYNQLQMHIAICNFSYSQLTA